ncbi:hypothetical protein C6P46_004263 [Rhodotorula mucilaginosa]|uniref:Uncharacterized protein n=1 Tax=Rhodotorula mucilaginosa TaxID=5537 RepID=A0A9P6W964_RHOMI|nr:hypothetical protein C6P46_004263 [Rhodotorula mucilaginosa]
MPGLLSTPEAQINMKQTAGENVSAEKANLREQFDGYSVASTDSSDSSSDAPSLCVPEIVVTPPNWPSSAEGGLRLDFSCQGWSSSSPEEYSSGDSDARECASILDRLMLSSSPRLKSPQRPVAPDLVLRAARRELLLQEIDAWSRVADERLAQWLQGSPTSSSSSSSSSSTSSSRTRDAQLASRAATRRQPRTSDVDLRVWVLHRALGTRHELYSPRELSARPPWALLV